MGDMSPHFSSAEFVCHGYGHRGHVSHGLVVDLELVRRLELLRSIDHDQPLVVMSGHRCRWWNQRVGGVEHSRHLVGEACDVQIGLYTLLQARQAGFRGIGLQGLWVVHVDVRADPAEWQE